MSKLTTCLWFDGTAEQAAKFYLSVFEDGKITSVSHYGDGRVLTVSFELDGQRFCGLNGGPHHPFTEAISIMVDCDSQEKVDRYWSMLTADGGAPSQCGWLKDKFGVSWQIVPRRLMQLLQDPDRALAGRVMQAMMKMTKIDIPELEAAAKG